LSLSCERGVAPILDAWGLISLGCGVKTPLCAAAFQKDRPQVKLP
jgi:hypothetical protein